MAVPDPRVALLWSEDELPLWKPPGDLAAVRYVTEKEAWRDRQMQEYRRLLYVGLTRAQDRLYICGGRLCGHRKVSAGILFAAPVSANAGNPSPSTRNP